MSNVSTTIVDDSYRRGAAGGQRQSPNNEVVNTTCLGNPDTVKAGSDISTLAANYGEVSNKWMGKWSGINGKWYTLDWGGNGYTGARATALESAEFFHALTTRIFFVQVAVDVYEGGRGFVNHDSGAMVGAGADLTFGTYGVLGGPAGIFGAVIYTGASYLVNIPPIYNHTVIPIVNAACKVSGC